MKIFVIGLCIGLLLGNFIGIVLMGLMVAASNEDRSREYNTLLNKNTQELTEMVDDYGKAIFQEKCPYTGNNCESWVCSNCEVEKAERELFNAES